jgi:hypothetical protein
MPSSSSVLSIDPARALGQSVGFAAFVWGYPLVESVRTCRLQTLGPVAEPTAAAAAPAKAAWAAPINALAHVERVAVAADRDIVTPANDLLYTTGWFNLADGPLRLQVPSQQRHGGRYFVLALYDAWTNNFANPGLGSDPAGEELLLVGPNWPSSPEPAGQPGAGVRRVQSPTNLVWMIGRVVAGEGADVDAARLLQSEIAIDSVAGRGQPDSSNGLPNSANQWQGPTSCTCARLEAGGADTAAVARDFFNNLCRAWADFPPPPADLGLAAWFARAGLSPHAGFDCSQLPVAVQEGLTQGLLGAVAQLVQASRSRKSRPWAAHWGIGRYGTEYLTRALTAYKGLGALAPEEAVYAMGDFDSERQPLDGSHRYTMRFAPGEGPPVDAFWSVTLYGADRFLHPNALGRYALGDRSQGLQRDADGGLTLHIGNAPQGLADGSPSPNWLPAPAGSFYLILRMYRPRPEARTWVIPPLQRLP